MNILGLPERDFLAMLPELRQQGVDTDALIRQYREANSALSGAYSAASASEAGIAAEGRRTVAGGLFSKPDGATGMDAVRGLRPELGNALRNILAGGARAVDAPAAAARGLIPQGDMTMEALGTAGLASVGGGAATRPSGSFGMGGRVAGEAMPEPRNAAERMARDILDMRAAGRASDVTDEMMARADPQYMFNNTPLPMDEASRLARAGEAGFDTGTPLYHGTNSDFHGFDERHFGKTDEGFAGRGIYSTDEPMLAEEYGSTVIPHVRSSSNDFVVNPDKSISSEGYDAISDRFGVSRERDRTGATAAAVTDRARSEGYTGFWINDRLGDEVASEVVTFAPRNIRSRFARFDPEFAHLSNLSAANANTLAGYLALLSEEQQGNALAQMQTRQPQNALQSLARGY